jgi:hypothetical protein
MARQPVAHAIPRLRAAGPDVHARLERARIIEAGRTNDPDVRSRRPEIQKQRQATIAAELAPHRVAGVGRHGVGPGVSAQQTETRPRNDCNGRHRRTARALASRQWQ